MPNLTLKSEIQYLKGVGPRRAEVLAEHGIKSVYDLMHYLPRRFIDRTMITPIGSLKANMNATIIGQVLAKGVLRGRKARLEVTLGDKTGNISLIWFAGYKYMDKMFTKGDIFAATGPVTYFMQSQMVHPELERIEDDTEELIHAGRIIPIYPMTAELKKAGMTGRIFRQIINNSLKLLGDKVPEFLPRKHFDKFSFFDMSTALKQAHYPSELKDAELARKRLAFNELMELQYLILMNRQTNDEAIKKKKCKKPQTTVKEFGKKLKFKLTTDQKSAVETIFNDMRAKKPMHRLLQGDVGCGKTVVAVLASVYAAENDFQTAFMAPTELLAAQHYDGWKDVLMRSGIKSALVTGSQKKMERRRLNKSLEAGDIQILFGTHAVISEDVVFKNLGLVIIDEQHRFGVRQRGQLIAKGSCPDVLVMTATPIPRTLALTLYGDLDFSSIVTMPPGRNPVKTVWRMASSRNEIYEYIRQQIDSGGQAFFVYPLVEKSEKLDLQSAEDEYKKMKNSAFKNYKVGLVHGRMKQEKRDKVICAFRDREIDLLVSTTVIEVGIDIPSATMIVIEHAERFGLAQLHQLRGRVGRGARSGMAIAIATPPMSDISKKRLDMFQSTTDGFKISEADLELRGPGEFFGTRQHGLPELKIANLNADTVLLPFAREVIASILNKENPDASEKKLLNYIKRKNKSRMQFFRTG